MYWVFKCCFLIVLFFGYLKRYLFADLDAGTDNKKLQGGGGQRNLEDLIRIMDTIAQNKLSDEEKLVLTGFVDAAMAKSDSAIDVHDKSKICGQAVEQVQRNFNETQGQLQDPKLLAGKDKCPSMEFWEISGVLLWSLLGLGLAGVCTWRLCLRRW